MSIRDRVVAHENETPTRVATTVVEENEAGWVVQCEGGCGNKISTAKRYYKPQDYSLGLESPMIQVNVTAPAARRCALCGPFPTQ